ncbi:uncharacterized protein Dwil_GK11565 [Drosophila willistoni]|uniref:Conserved oligomeric Golgi complex subunit 1 n=1 Tax=Drosophila willistoni TaxID=7260 RepID=B4N8Z1_DROWI|nr:conserved oligomeric Golgi complex subunit 1 [Drosophila willistoni]EDW80496.1 uncharacterized protein Dwil_GK11565 [Drosophila willistoni]
MTASLLNLNVDTLFEQNNVSEIDAVHKKIQTVVENKREELRTQVGERYRDLLKAADTIAAMQTSAGTLIEQVHHVQENCRKLNEQQLLGFKDTLSPPAQNTILEGHGTRSKNKKLQNYYSCMVQIKLLTSLPELIWTHIDNEHFYAATELFIFSRHISTGLQLDGQSELMQKLPVAAKQWEILRPFHLTIKQAIMSVLERETINSDVAVDCLQSLLLLDKCDLVSAIKTFLHLRATAFLNSLESKTGKEPRRVKERILASLGILNDTIELIEKCLLENGGLLFSRIKDCNSSAWTPSINRMESSERQLAYLLPDIIANFKPQFDDPKLEVHQMSAALQQFLDKIDSLASKQLEQIFALVSNMQTIQDIKSTASATQERLNFNHLEQYWNLKASQLDFYGMKYTPLIHKRIREIIRNSWSLAMTKTYEKVLQQVETGQLPVAEQIWREQSEDLPLSLAAALNDQPKRLANRTKGYDSSTIDVCKQFDSYLADIVKEMNVLLQEQTTKSEDKLELIQFLRETAQEQITQYLGRLKSLKLKERRTLLQALSNTLALVELCPNLKLCFCPPSSWRQWSANSMGLEHWPRLCGLIEDEMFQFWLLVIDNVLSANSCKDKMPKAMNHEVVLRDFPLWQSQTLEQRDEDDPAERVQSTIRIPIQPRLSLQTYLHDLIHSLNQAVPQTLPPKVLQAFNQKLLSELLSHYESLSTSDCAKSSQNISLQLYFDLKFLERLFGITREERSLYDRFHSLQLSLKDCIDPFDFELFAEHISTHVARSSNRLHGEFGVLTPNSVQNQKNSIISPSNSSSLAHEADPNVLCLSSSGSTSLWFPLLPIVVPPQGLTAPTMAAERKTELMESEKTTPTRKTATTTRKSEGTNKSKSSAASFFGMSQEWFRSS